MIIGAGGDFSRRVVLLVAAILAGAALVASCGADTSVEPATEAAAADRVVRAQEAAAELGKRLKGRLLETLASEGPVAAIRVCSEEAPAIAADVSETIGMRVSRTSLRVRNPDNAPDARERAVLELWQSKVEDGTPAAALQTFVSDEGAFLWMKPIVAEPPCLTCHGRSIPDNVAEAIAERYPQDRATGFSAGDLRGAFVVR